MRYVDVACTWCGDLGIDTLRHLVVSAVVPWMVVQLLPHAPVAEAGPSFDNLWCLVDGRSLLGPRTGAAIAMDIEERAYNAVRQDGARAFFPSAAARHRELRRRDSS